MWDYCLCVLKLLKEAHTSRATLCQVEQQNMPGKNPVETQKNMLLKRGALRLLGVPPDDSREKEDVRLIDSGFRAPKQQTC